MKKRLLSLALLIISIMVLASCKEEKLPPDPEAPLSHVHEFGGWIDYQRRTCVLDGIRYRKCVCGEVEVEQITASGHLNTDWIVSEPTCTASGNRYKLCTECGVRTYFETLPALGHIYDVNDEWNVVEPDCVKDGYKTLHCTRCGVEVMREAIPALGHDYSAVTTLPTSDTIGYTTYTCTRCAYTYEDDLVAACGNVHFRYTIDGDSTCKIIGFYGENENVLLPSGSDVYELLVPEKLTGILDGNAVEYTVVAIGADAFNGYNTLTKVFLPKTVTKIEDRAFAGCTKLDEVRIGSPVESIGASAFDGCELLSKIMLPATVTKIGERAFAGCSSLEKLDIPDGVKVIADGLFDGCSALTSVKFSKNVESIGEYAFASCESLNSIPELPAVKSIGQLAFFNCKSLGSVSFGADLEFVGTAAFLGTDALATVSVPSVKDWLEIVFVSSTSNPLYGSAKLIADNSVFTSLSSTYGIDRIGEYQFFGYNHLTSVKLNQTVTSIGKSAFEDCTGLKTVALLSGVEEIAIDTFTGCSSLSSVTLGDSVTAIGINAFAYCSNLKTLNFSDNLETIGEYAFVECASLSSVNLKNVSLVHTYAFYKCTNLSSVTWSDKLTVIADSAFEKCGLSGALVLPEGLEYVGIRAFADCRGISSVTIPESLTLIDAFAFDGAENIKSVYASDLALWCKIKFINESSNPLLYAEKFYIDGELLTVLIIDGNLETISDYSLWRCLSVEEVYFVGTADDLCELAGDNNPFLTYQVITGDIYYFSAVEPVGSGKFWYYNESGNICKW